MRDHDTFGLPRGAGGVDDIGQIGRVIDRRQIFYGAACGYYLVICRYQYW
ncbi:hypothetical protein Xets_03932 [Xenorhabdus sp. TS4]|nr:hypothetical protein [Xenorhabdus sp. TS4]